MHADRIPDKSGQARFRYVRCLYIGLIPVGVTPDSVGFGECLKLSSPEIGLHEN